MTRRDILRTAGNGFGLLGLAGLMPGQTRAAGPMEPRPTHFAPKAKHVIFLFLNGGPSHVDSFDPKPALEKYHGQEMPEKDLGPQNGSGEKSTRLMRSPFAFRQYGQSGLPVSELFPHIGGVIDDVCVVRSMYTDLPAHPQAIMQMNSGRILAGMPSMGSWVTYGLGTENQNLPGFVALCPGTPNVGPELWSAGFLPAVHQGTYVPCEEIQPEKMIRYLRNPRYSTAEQRSQLDLTQALNRLDIERRGNDPLLEGRIQSMEIAFRMQMEAMDAFDVSKESEAARALYGVPLTPPELNSKKRSATRDGDFARGCLIARRLVERGVRFVQVYFGEDIPWDSHHDIMVHKPLARQADQPIAGLIRDLKQRGLLNETLILVGGEFGRTPWVETAGRMNVQNGRNHNSKGFTYLMAGGGVKGGIAYGATDEFGFKAAEKPVHVHDLHATALHLLGMDHRRLTYRHSGRDFRLTDVAGNVVRDIIA
ncbi:MAG: DUF1501 domain-containing protein [Bryobacteraceae bacterium]|nr:DUF1501 domain-containing protein [Bryobacteraceae bacterium]